ncbi:uncharacterized protein LOC109717061 [Ananas comosus]|uniref:Uncharacterized protein LOC109717061 n=1 Tax=Ananas comosus TaxID=4615 RepID=A0A6P5FXR6_ANACO|nr:uncharacterized protein LOC109717061 [Ananas comosus]
MSTLFIALQCIQCSTMQVKQQKKSRGNSNKWVCAVCNLRQSVRRVHARGPIARDLRGFVQEFNLSRAVHGSDGSDPIPILRSSGSLAPDGFGERHKRRMDWSEYLDPHEEEEEEAGGGGDGVAVAMDLPPQNFENLSQKGIKQTESFKPDFSKRKRSEEKGSFPGQNSSQPSGMGPKKTLETKVRSKWSEYLEEEDTGETFGREVCVEQSSRYYELRGGKESQLSDSLVADEIHPDFK